MRPIPCMAAAVLAAAPPGMPTPFEHAPIDPQSRLAVTSGWMAYSVRVDDVLQVVASPRERTSRDVPVLLFRPRPGRMALASAFAPDGRTLYFESNARITDVPDRDDSDVWVVEHDGVAWGRPRPLGAPWDSRFNEHSPTVDTTGRLCVNSARPDGIGENDVYCGTVAGAPPRLLEQVNSPHQDAFPALAPAGDAVVFASDRPGGLGGWDLYVSWTEDGIWSRPHNLGAPINSPADELNPTIVAGQARLVFTRAIGEGATRRRQLLVVPFMTHRVTTTR